MFILPDQTNGAIVGIKKPTFFRFKKKLFFLVSIFSSLSLLDFNFLKFKAKTPYLNPIHEIYFNSFFENRSLIFFDKTIFVLDNFIPTFKMFFEKEKISKVIHKKNNLFIYYPEKRKIQSVNPMKMCVKWEFCFSFQIMDFIIIEKNKKNILLGFSKLGLVEIWDISSMKLYKIFRLKIKEDILYIKSTISTHQIFVILKNGQIFCFDLEGKSFQKKKKIFLPKKISEINCISFSFPFIFFLGKRINYFYNFYNEKSEKVLSSTLLGKKFHGNFVGNSRLFFSYGIFDNFMKILKFDKKKNKFKLLKEKYGIFTHNEILRICSIYGGKILFLSKEKFVCSDSGSILEFPCFSEKKKKFSRKILKNILINISKKNEEKIFILINFFKKKKPLFFEIIGHNFKKINQKNIELPKKVDKIISTLFINFENKILLGCNKNKIVLNDFSDSNKSEYFINQHKNRRKRINCIVTALAINKNNSFFLSGCVHGTLKLWNKNDLKDSKKLKLHQKITQLDYNTESELILIIMQDNYIYLLFPETFSLKFILKGHSGQITDFRYFDNGKFLFTTSLDKTLKIWNIKRKKVVYSLKLKFPIISFEIDMKKNYLISSHHFTRTLGFWSIIRKFERTCNPKNFCLEKNGVVEIKKRDFLQRRKKKKKIFKKKKARLLLSLFNHKMCDNFLSLKIQDELKFVTVVLDVRNFGERENFFKKNENFYFHLIFYLEILIEDLICGNHIKKNLKNQMLLCKFFEKKKKKSNLLKKLSNVKNLELLRIKNCIENKF